MSAETKSFEDDPSAAGLPESENLEAETESFEEEGDLAPQLQPNETVQTPQPVETGQAEKERSDAILIPVNSATSIDKLCDTIEEAKIIYGQGNESTGPGAEGVKSEEVTGRIKDFEIFVKKNMGELLTSVLVKRTGNINNLLTDNLNEIPMSHGIRAKTKALMEKEWNKHFKENRDKVTNNACMGARTLSELSSFTGNFKVIQADGKEYENPAKTAEDILRIDRIITNEAARNDFTISENVRKLREKFITPFLRTLPGYSVETFSAGVSGQELIFYKAGQLISERITEERLKRKSDSMSEPGGPRKFLGGLRKRLFGRKK